MPVLSKFGNAKILDQPLTDILLKAIEENGDSIAFIDGDTGEKFSYRRLKDLIFSAAVGLDRAGLRKDEVGVLCLPNCPEYAIIVMAMALRGGIVSGINPVYTEHELRGQFEDSKCKFVFTHESMVQKCQQAANSVGDQIEKIYIIGGRNYQKSRITEDFDNLYNNPGSAYAQLPRVGINTMEDVLLMPYSSGTTGPPKGVMLTHYNLTSMTYIADDGNHFLWPQKGENYLAFLPFFHIFGFAVLLFGLRKGVTTITVSKFEAEKYLKQIQEYKPKMLFVVPPVLVFLAKHPVVSNYDISSVESIFVGAAPVGKDLSEELLRRLKHLKYLLQGYGMTETTGGSHITPPVPRDQLKHGSCGVLVPNFECKIIDTDSGKELGPNETGEICVRSVTLMKGYFKRPEATANTIDPDGWLHTGDIGYYDNDEYFFVVDRLKELIKVRGFQVPPAELEDLLLSHPEIQDAAVIGIPDETAGEFPRAYVVRKTETLTEEAVKDFVRGKVAHYKELKGGVEFSDVIPKSPSGKILRRVLKSQFTNQSKAKL